MSEPTALGAPRYRSVVTPSAPLVVTGAVVAAIGVVTGLVIASMGGWSIGLGALVLLSLMGLGWLIARAAVTVTVTDSAIHVHYTLSSRTVAMSDVTDVGAGDHVNGVGYGWGMRWEGRGKWAYRVGGPMATVVHRSGRLGVSVEDPHEFVEAVVAARGDVA
ncbi:hypothetical protein N802_09730 [Knoellia sinensis KCTC 19936]|uniref:Bacterial Pleckstrin homology domain-containing protein n=1 Tax=Knoellia sinensis KCTC 19936 TaxID=1385520 RepID=A0A0A0IZC5_9MICO|nr:hypothetical protein [Knoellia sinensis]KGN30143.1 hypothetical protein N802_09730 [Knoellia sinensis KCTC 19936]